jgi:hypothetical protein
MRTPAASFSFFASIALLGCAEPSGGNAAPSAQPAASTPAPLEPPPAPAPAPEQAAAPADLDLAALKKALKCASDAKSGPCALLNAFGSCTPWAANVPSGDGRWIGQGYRVEGGKTTEEPTIVRARRVPANEVAPGQMTVKIGIADIAKEEGSAYSQADKVWKALARGDVPAKSNPALEYLKRRAEWPEGYATKTVSGQVYVAAHGGTFVCQGPKQQLYLVQRAATRGSQGDGLYAEVWAATW